MSYFFTICEISLYLVIISFSNNFMIFGEALWSFIIYFVIFHKLIFIVFANLFQFLLTLFLGVLNASGEWFVLQPQKITVLFSVYFHDFEFFVVFHDFQSTMCRDLQKYWSPQTLHADIKWNSVMFVVYDIFWYNRFLKTLWNLKIFHDPPWFISWSYLICWVILTDSYRFFLTFYEFS